MIHVISNYNAAKHKYLTAPAPGQQRARDTLRSLAFRCLKHPTYYFVEAYWEYLIYHTTVFESTLTDNGYEASEVNATIDAFAAKLQAIIDAFKLKNPSLSENACLIAYKEAQATWESHRCDL